MSQNQAKYQSYRFAWQQLEAASDAGFYLEAITIAESIMSDRLLSYVLGVAPTTRFDLRTPFKNLVDKWRKEAGPDLFDEIGRDLGEAVDLWREDRNRLVHGIAKSMPATPTRTVQAFRKAAKDTAGRGAKLAREVSVWHKRTKSRAGRSARRVSGLT